MAEKKELARNWTFVVYPEESNSNFFEILKGLCVAGTMSPLHTPENEKKHYHILICGEKKSAEQIKSDICERLGEVVQIDGKKSIKGVTRPEKVLNLRSMVRYFRHLDDSDKQQFSDKNLDFGGFSSARYEVDSDAEGSTRYTLIKAVTEIIKTSAITSLIDLLDTLGAKALDEEFKVVCDNAYLFNALIRSYNNSLSRQVIKEMVGV